MAGKFGDLIKKAREPESQKSGLESALKRDQADEPEVNLCVKVPKSLRQHWAAEAKRQGTTMTSVIVEALSARFGKPD
jgi:hypothetical protein